MKEKNRSIILSGFSLFTVTVYFLLNSAFMLEWYLAKGVLSAFSNAVFTLDLFTWHIYGLFAILTFIIRIFSVNRQSSRAARLNAVLHLVFMSISFFEIYYMIQIAF